MRWRDGFCADEVHTVDGRAMKVGDRHFRSIWLENDGWSVGAIDQRRLPHEFIVVRLETCDAAADAIRSMLVRGAPLIGATAAYGMALAMRADPSDAALDRAHDAIGDAAHRDQPALGARRMRQRVAAATAGRTRVRRLMPRRRGSPMRTSRSTGDRPARARTDRGDGRTEEAGRAGQRADALQRRLAGDGRLGHGDGADLPGA